jgi:DNA-binding MarR family transcriptional regulator
VGYIVCGSIDMAFTKLEHDLYFKHARELTLTEFAVWINLKVHYNAKRKLSWPSEATIMKETGIKSKTTVIRSLKGLEAKGYIKKDIYKYTVGGHCNGYEILI